VKEKKKKKREQNYAQQDKAGTNTRTKKNGLEPFDGMKKRGGGEKNGGGKNSVTGELWSGWGGGGVWGSCSGRNPGRGCKRAIERR